MDVAAFRGEFPVLERVAYLNTGTQGPVPRRGAEAAAERIRAELEEGRGGERHFAALGELAERLRVRLAEALGCAPEEVALTRSTTDGVSTALSAMRLGRGDEVLTSDEEHPGLLAPLATARRRCGFSLRVVPFAELGGSVAAATRLVACSHVSWVSGRVVDLAPLRGSDVQVLLDGAQGLGAVPLSMDELRCDFYAASGQKWLCGPDGSGSLFVRRDRLDDLSVPWPSYVSLADPARPSELIVHAGARRFDMGVAPGPATAWALAAIELLAQTGWDEIYARARTLAARLADDLSGRGRKVVARGESTLVAWRSAEPERDVERLAREGIVVRHLPGRGLVRASVGAWSGEEELERLAELA